MSRNFSNTLVFEAALDSIDNSDPILYNVAENVFKPVVRITEEDCQTLLGKNVPVSYRIEGEVEVSTGLVIDTARLNTLITSGSLFVDIRDLSTCIAENGVCRKCLGATYPRLTVPAINSFYKIAQEVRVDCSQLVLETGNNSLLLPYSINELDKIYVFEDGALIAESEYTIVDKTITFNTTALSDTILVFKYAVLSNITYYYWIANTYSGSLLGIMPFGKVSLPVRKELLISSIPQADVDSLIDNLKTSTIGQEDSVQYIDNIKDPLEKAVFTVLLTSIFLNN